MKTKFKIVKILYERFAISYLEGNIIGPLANEQFTST